MAIVVSKVKNKVFEYIPISERNSENPVKVKIRLIPKTERAKLEDALLKINPDGTFTFANATYVLEMFRRGVVDIEGLLDENGNEIKVEKDADGYLTYEFIELLPDDFIQEVGNVIVSISKDPQNAELYLGNQNVQEGEG